LGKLKSLFLTAPKSCVLLSGTSSMRTKEYEIALSLFERIRDSFPALAMKIDLQPSIPVDLTMDIPVQQGLSFSVWLDLQNRDSLCLAASGLIVELFPCTKSDRVDNFFEAVSGLLSGRFRILQYRRGHRVVKAKLQKPIENGWKTVAGSSCLLSIPWPRKT